MLELQRRQVTCAAKQPVLAQQLIEARRKVQLAEGKLGRLLYTQVMYSCFVVQR